MPIEIRELVIRATVDPHSTGKGTGNCASGTSQQGDKRGGGASGAAGVDDDVVQSCVREVMRILGEKRER